MPTTLESRLASVLSSIKTDIRSVSSQAALDNLLIYYGYPSSYNNIGTNAGVIAEISAKYNIWVCGDGIQNALHLDYVNTTAIIAGVRANGVKVFGYVPIGTSTSNRSLATMYTAIDEWVTLGIDGIFLDEFGFDYLNTRTRQKAVVDYVHGKNLPVCANAWTFNDFVCDTATELPWPSNDWRYINFATYNPTNIALTRNPSDIWLAENFAYDNTGALDKWDTQDRIYTAATLNVTKNVKIWGMAVFPEVLPGVPDFSKTGSLLNLKDIANYLVGNALLYGISVMGLGGYSFGSTNGMCITQELPKLPSGIDISYGVVASNYSTGVFTRSWGKTLLTVSNLNGIQNFSISGSSTLESTNPPKYASPWTMTTGVIAAGTDQATATQLTDVVCNVSVVDLGTGVRLPTASFGHFISVGNHGLNNLLVYPLLGESVEELPINTPLTLLPGQVYRAACPIVGYWYGIDINTYDDERSTHVLPLMSRNMLNPPDNSMLFGARDLAGRTLPGFMSSSGAEALTQPHLGRSRVCYFQANGNGTTTALLGFAAVTAVGTATARNVAATNILTRMKRVGYVSAATAGSLSGIYVPVAQFTMGAGSGLGGFHFVFKGAIYDIATVAGATSFIGMQSSVAAPTNVQPNTLTNAVGIAQLTADATQWYFVYGGSAAQTAIPLGTALGAPTALNTVMEISLFSYPNTVGKLGYEVRNVTTGVYVSGTLIKTTGTQFPAATTFLAPRAWRCNNATALAVGLDISSLYLETDY